MTKKWSSSTLEEIVNFIDYRGKTPKKVEQGLRLITAKNVKYGYIKDTPMEFVEPEIYDQWMTRGIPRKGDVLFTTEAPLGNVAQLDTDEKVVFAQRIIIMQPNLDKLDSTFLKYILLSKSMQKEIHLNGTGATAKGIKSKLLKKITIPIPPLETQKRIVEILDEVFEGIEKAIANTKQNLINARELFDSYLNNIFTNKGTDWVEKKLGEVCRIEKKNFTGNELPYVGLENIESGTGRFLGSIESQTVKSSTFEFNNKHLLYGRLRPYLNKVMLPDFSGHCSSEIFPLLVNHRLNRSFLFYWFTNNTTVDSINRTSTGARMPRANMKEVLLFKFSFPPIEKQIKIVKKLDKLSEETQRLEENYQRKVELLEELKQSILERAFRGELTDNK